MTRSAPALRSWPPTMASVQPEPRRSSSRTPAPGGGVPVTRNAPRTLAACWTALAISTCGGRCSVRASKRHCGDAQRCGHLRREALRRVAEPDRRHRRDPGRHARARAHRLRERGHDVVLESVAAQAALHRRPPAAVAETGQRPAGLDADILGDLAHRPRRVRRHLLDLELDRRERRWRPASSTSAGSGGAANRGAVQTAQRPQSWRLRIVELLLQDAHQAAAVGAEALHRALLVAAQRGDARVALAVVAPVRRLGRQPARAVTAQRALDVEDLQHRLQPARADVDHAPSAPAWCGPASPAVLEVVEHRGDPLARRERLLDEEVLDPAVLDAAQQDHVGVLDAAAGAADLLVVGHDRARAPGSGRRR